MAKITDINGNLIESLKWIDYATGFTVIPTINTVIASGTVYNYIYNGITRFRLVPSGAEIDAFYSAFTGGVLSGLLAQKTQNI